MIETYTIAICTLGNNINLKNCLSDLKMIRAIYPSMVDILVVMNRNELNSDFELINDVRIIYENNRGYSNVRNAAIHNTPSNSNLIFIDDDEIVSLKWFESLIEKHVKFPNDILFGPVYSTSENHVISYRNRFKKHFSKMPDEFLVKHASTANLLIPISIIEKGIVKFDPIFNQSGSEDTDFCFRMINHGYKIRFVKFAIVYEVEKEDRFEKSYLDRRFIRDVSNYSFILRKNSTKLRVCLRFLTLLIRVFIYSIATFFNSTFKLEKTAYTNSLKALIRNRLQEFL